MSFWHSYQLTQIWEKGEGSCQQSNIKNRTRVDCTIAGITLTYTTSKLNTLSSITQLSHAFCYVSLETRLTNPPKVGHWTKDNLGELIGMKATPPERSLCSHLLPSPHSPNWENFPEIEGRAGATRALFPPEALHEGWADDGFPTPAQCPGDHAWLSVCSSPQLLPWARVSQGKKQQSEKDLAFSPPRFLSCYRYRRWWSSVLVTLLLWRLSCLCSFESVFFSDLEENEPRELCRGKQPADALSGSLPVFLLLNQQDLSRTRASPLF